MVDTGSEPKIITKTLWTCCVEAVTEYCRIIFDLFPDDYQVSVFDNQWFTKNERKAIKSIV